MFHSKSHLTTGLCYQYEFLCSGILEDSQEYKNEKFVRKKTRDVGLDLCKTRL
jgi:hypothetical protein